MRNFTSLKRNLKKSVALVLVCAVTATCIDTTAFAADGEAREEEAYIVRELTDERTVNSTTYLLSDGLKMTEYYTSDIRFYDEDGELTDYDGSLVPYDGGLDSEDASDDGTEIDADGYAYENAAGDIKHYFPESISEETPVVTEYGEYRVSFAPVTDESMDDITVDGTPVDDTGSFCMETDAATSSENEFSENGFAGNEYGEGYTTEEVVEDIYGDESEKTVSITYEENIPYETDTDDCNRKEINVCGTDEDSTDTDDILCQTVNIEYTSYEYGIKENIVINENNGISAYAFKLNLKGLTPEYNEFDGSISLLDKETGEYKAGIEAPNVNDATGEAYSEDVWYTIEKAETDGSRENDTNTDTYILTVYISSEYLNDEERVYPVTVDPSISWSGSSQLCDTYIIKSSTYSSINFYASGVYTFSVGKGSQGVFRSYIKFPNLKSYVGGMYVASAYLTVYENGSYTSGTKINAKRVTESFSMSSVTWNNQPSYASTVYASITSSGSSGASHKFDLTTYVQGIAKGSYSNYGLMLMASTESSSNYVKFYGFRSSATSKIPKLTVTYYDPPTAPTSVTLGSTYIKEGGSLSVSYAGISSKALSKVQYMVKKYNTSSSAYETYTSWATFLTTSSSSGSKTLSATSSYGEGQYRIYLRGVDESGIAGSSTGATFYIDGTVPVISSSSISPSTSSSSYSSSLPTVKWSVTESYFSKIQYSLNGGSYAALSTSKSSSASISSLTSESANTIKIRAVDKAGNVSSVKTFTYYYDATNPVINTFTVNGLTDDSEDNEDADPVISYKVTDGILKDVQYRINSGSWISLGSSSSGSATISGLTINSDNTISLRAVDKAGNYSSVKTIGYGVSQAAPEWQGMLITYSDIENDTDTSGDTPGSKSAVVNLIGMDAENNNIDTGNVYYAVVAADGDTGEDIPYTAAENVSMENGTLTFSFDTADISQGIYNVYVKTYLVSGSNYEESSKIWYYFPDAEYDGTKYLSASYDEDLGMIYLDFDNGEDTGTTDESTDISDDTDTSAAITSYEIFTRYGDGSFTSLRQLDADETELYVSVDDIETSVDFRALITYDDGSEALTNAVTISKEEYETESEEDADSEEETDDDSSSTEIIYVQDYIDADGDGLTDVYEIWDFGTDIDSADSDLDGFDDYYEVTVLGTDPAVYTEDKDSDSDGLTDLSEYNRGTHPYLADTDFDGYSDSEDNAPFVTDINGAANADYNVQAHVGLYDREYSETENGVTYTYIENIYSGVTSSVITSDGKKSIYVYDKNGNITADIEYADSEYIANTYAYDEGNNLIYVYHNGFAYTYEYEYGTVTEDEESGEDTDSEDADEQSGAETTDYTDAMLKSVSVCGTTLVSYTSNITTDNSENADSLNTGDILTVTEDVKTYGNGGSVKTVTTEYKIPNEDGTDASESSCQNGVAYTEEIYYNDDTDPSYTVSYDTDGNVISKTDNTISAGAVTYEYIYSDDGNTVKKSKINAEGTEIYSVTRTYSEESSTETDGVTETSSKVTTAWEWTTYPQGCETLNESVFTTEYFAKTTDSAACSKVISELTSGDINVITSLTGTGLNFDGEADDTVTDEQNTSMSVIYDGETGDEIISKTTESVETEDGIKTTVTYQNGTEAEYTYDNDGNIIKTTTYYYMNIDEGEYDVVEKTYTYDGFGRLTKTVEGYPGGKYSTVYKYEYDAGGNLLSETWFTSTDGETSYNGKIYTYTYEYDETWKDKLVSYNGITFEYDDMGNMTSYFGMNLTWEGRLLSSYGGTTYTYDENGIRTGKYRSGTNYSEYTEYEYDGTDIVYEHRYYEYKNVCYSDYYLYYIYDGNGEIIGFTLDGLMDSMEIDSDTYYYGKNAQGDVITVYNEEGKVYAIYSYTEWGSQEMDYLMDGEYDVAQINPIRYRSYYYDIDEDLYYLQSRYYDPYIKRFLSADDTDYLGISGTVFSYNAFAYCEDDPVNKTDPSGTIAANIVGAVIGAIIGAVGGYFLSSWLADKIGLKGWKRTVFIAGLTALVTASAAAIGYFIGPYVAKAWSYWTAKLVGLVKGLYTCIGEITSSKMSHINTSQHLWNKVMSKVTTTQIKTIIYQGIRKGSWSIQETGVIKILYKYKGNIVVITGKVVDKIFKIGDAWIWNGKGTP